MSRKTYEGRTAAEAAIKACEELDVPRSQLKYEIVSDEGEGLNRKVAISVEASELSAPRRDNGHGEDDAADEPPRRDAYRPEARGDHGNDRGGERGRRGRRGGRGGRGGRERDFGDRHGGRGGRGRPRPDRDDGEGFESLLNLEVMPATLPPPRPEVTTPPSPKAQKGKEVLERLLAFMELGVTAHLVQDQPEEIHFELRGADVAPVIGKKGDVLLSLQFILNRIVSRGSAESEAEGEGGVLVLDAAGYRVRRREALAELAKKLAARAIQEQKVVRLSPMSAHDRRVFHLTLKEMEGVNTRSEGEGLYRNLLIIPAQFG